MNIAKGEVDNRVDSKILFTKQELARKFWEWNYAL